MAGPLEEMAGNLIYVFIFAVLGLGAAAVLAGIYGTSLVVMGVITHGAINIVDDLVCVGLALAPWGLCWRAARPVPVGHHITWYIFATGFGLTGLSMAAALPPFELKSIAMSLVLSGLSAAAAYAYAFPAGARPSLGEVLTASVPKQSKKT